MRLFSGMEGLSACRDQVCGNGIEESVANGSRHIAAALAAHSDDGRHVVLPAGGKQEFFALHHVHKAYRYADD